LLIIVQQVHATVKRIPAGGPELMQRYRRGDCEAIVCLGQR
jgi:hypothetical protein